MSQALPGVPARRFPTEARLLGLTQNAMRAFDYLGCDITVVPHLHAVDGAGLRDKEIEAANAESSAMRS